ncbi:MAG: WG repeat-containing protein [Bacteroidota bacterium]|nr:WG repeat-containing protein [Bacteroidota bacterium]
MKEVYSLAARYSLISANGKDICHNCYIQVQPFKDGKAWVKDTTGLFHSTEPVEFNVDVYDFSVHASWGLINKKGKWLVKPTYQKLDSFVDGKAVVAVYSYNYIWQHRKTGDWNHVDSFAGIESKMDYRRVRERRVVQKKGMIDRDGHIIIPTNYEYLGLYINGLVLADLGSDWKDRQFAASMDGSGLRLGELQKIRYVLLDEKGVIVKKLPYDEVQLQLFRNESTASPKWVGQTYYYNYSFIPYLYLISKYDDSMQQMNYGIMDSKGNELAACKYNRESRVMDISPEGNDSEMVIYEEPFFYYNKAQEQIVFLFEERNNWVYIMNSMIVDLKGNVLYKRKADESIVAVNFKQSWILFEKKTADSNTISFVYPFSTSYDSVGLFFRQFDTVKNLSASVMDIYDVLDPDLGSLKSADFLLVNRGSYYGVWNKYAKEIIPIEHYRMLEEYNTDGEFVKIIKGLAILTKVSANEQYIFYRNKHWPY